MQKKIDMDPGPISFTEEQNQKNKQKKPGL